MLAGHDKMALWFSGGKDSMACLYLLRPYLDTITVLWVNTGKNYPEALAVVEQAKALCPNWQEIVTDRDAQWADMGMPSDVVPMDHTVSGEQMTHAKPVRIQAYTNCCLANIALPLWKASHDLGATMVIRGQRADEPRRSTTINGGAMFGMKVWHPIEQWTKEMVLSYLHAEMPSVPAHYAIAHSSLDCYDCTAFAANSLDRVQWMRKTHPEKHLDYMAKLTQVVKATHDAMQPYSALLRETPCSTHLSLV